MFLCTNGTLFNQQEFTCDWWYNVNCAEAPAHYRYTYFPFFCKLWPSLPSPFCSHSVLFFPFPSGFYISPLFLLLFFIYFLFYIQRFYLFFLHSTLIIIITIIIAPYFTLPHYPIHLFSFFSCSFPLSVCSANPIQYVLSLCIAYLLSSSISYRSLFSSFFVLNVNLFPCFIKHQAMKAHD